MERIFDEAVRDTALCKMIDKAADFVRRENLGFSSTGCQTQEVFIASLIHHCIDNDAIFTDTQSKNIINILNSV